MYKKRGQVWVETVIYTLIALLLIGAVLAFIVPKIQDIRDKATVDQSVEMLQNIDGVISSIVLGGSGNKRILEIGIKKGDLIIDSQRDKIIFEIESQYVYSQEGENISIGNAVLLTEKLGSLNKISLTNNYSKYNLTYDGKEEIKKITQASTPYKISIENKGGTKTNINFVIN
jgi:type II secretory pathway pseudopilin PulG